ncbi:MAG: glycosyltransferase [Tissierellia bacterium]|jgi:glycosyltransferase|nr:glycosyltransferase [Tissierellia bacterium]
MKNIYIFDEYISSQKNGIGTYLRELLHCFKSSGHSICLIIFNADTEEFSIVEEKETKKLLFPVMKGHFLHHVQVMDKFLRLYIEDDPHNIFFLNHSPCGDLMESLKKIFPLSKIIFIIHDFGWTAPLMGNLKEYRRLVKNKSFYTDESKKVKGDFSNCYEEEKRMYGSADRIICLSPDSYAVLRSVYKLNKKKISFIPNGLRESSIVSKRKNSEEIRNSLNIKNDEKILVVIGRPTKQKGVFALMEAMKLVLKTNRNVRLVVIGDANEQSFRELVEKASFAATSITFTGLLDKYVIHKWLSIADIGIIPSYYEQFGFVGVEMMMHGLPIVASNGMGVKNMFENDKNAVIAKIGNRNNPNEYVRNLAKAIVKLLNSPDLCNRLSSEARKTYEYRYSIHDMKENYRALIESLC